MSLAVLAIFLFRKSQNIPAQEMLFQEEDSQQKRKLMIAMSSVGQFSLKVLEKLIQRIKLVSLKFHNTSNEWVHSIREKRQQRALAQQEMIKEQEAAEKIDNDIKNSQPVERSDEIEVLISEEKVIRPLVRETAVHPQNMAKEKNRLEEALIKRIALNPKDIEAYERLGDYYLESENYNDSHECFSQVLKLNPGHHKARIRIRRLEMLIK
jgi:tetratricopeptide (TPR) repeat protein